MNTFNSITSFSLPCPLNSFCINIYPISLDKITFAEFELLTSPEIYQQIKSYLGELEKKKSRVKSRQSFSTFLDPSANERRQEFFEKLHQRYKPSHHYLEGTLIFAVFLHYFKCMVTFSFRISKVTQLPVEMIKSSESLQVSSNFYFTLTIHQSFAPALLNYEVGVIIVRYRCSRSLNTKLAATIMHTMTLKIVNMHHAVT